MPEDTTQPDTNSLPIVTQDSVDQAAKGAQFTVTPIPFHTHNGTDSPPIVDRRLNTMSGTNLANVNSSGTINKVVDTYSVSATSSANKVVETNGSGKIDSSFLPSPISFDYQAFTSVGSNTWTKPTNATTSSPIFVQMWGGGGAGADTTTDQGGGGGGGGTYVEFWDQAGNYGSTVTLTVGAGGTVSGAGGNTNWNSNVVFAYGGAPGAANGSSQGGGGGGGGSFAVGGSASSATGGAGGGPGGGAAFTDTTSGFGGAGGGTGGGGNLTGGNSLYGGGGGGAAVSVGTAGNGGNSIYGGGGGGGSANGGSRGTGGTSTFGGAGGSGGARVNGTAGSAPGGGGGGSSQNGAGSKTGGAGGRGEVRVWTFL